MVVVTPVLLIGNALWNVTRLDRVHLGPALSASGSRSGRNILLVGTDSRAGIDPSDPNAAAFLGETVTGARTDTIIVMHLEHGTVELVSIPRDLWVTDPATGAKGRINSTFSSGPADLVAAVIALGIPIDHYVEVDFGGFADIVDALGGITIDFPAPAKDDHSGLSVPKAGAVHLDGTQALAYVRSRYYSELVNGTWRVDGTADLGRTTRQRAFFTALVSAITDTRSPITMARLPGSVRSGLRLDDRFGVTDMVGVASALRGAHPTSDLLPVVPRVTSGGADVLELGPGAPQAISRLAS